MISKKFRSKYLEDIDFRNFIDLMSDKDFIMHFVYDLYAKYGTDTILITSPWVSKDLLDINKLIRYFSGVDEFEKCAELKNIKNKL